MGLPPSTRRRLPPSVPFIQYPNIRMPETSPRACSPEITGIAIEHFVSPRYPRRPVQPTNDFGVVTDSPGRERFLDARSR